MADNISTPFDSFLTLLETLELSDFKVTIGELNELYEQEGKGQILVTEYNGMPIEGTPIEQPFVQIMVHSYSQVECKNVTWNLYNQLKSLCEQKPEGCDYRILKVFTKQSPHELPRKGKYFRRVFNVWFPAV